MKRCIAIVMMTGILLLGLCSPAAAFADDYELEIAAAVAEELDLYGRCGHTLLTGAEIDQAMDTLADYGLVVMAGDRPTRNYERADAFFSGTGDGSVIIFDVDILALFAHRYIRTNGQYTIQYITYYDKMVIGLPYPADDLYYIDGQLLIATNDHNYAYGKRVVPLPEGCYEAYERYVVPAWRAGILIRDWSADKDSLAVDNALSWGGAPEVHAVTEQPDGTLALDLYYTGRGMPHQTYHYATLTVRPTEDGFKFIANRLAGGQPGTWEDFDALIASMEVSKASPYTGARA